MNFTIPGDYMNVEIELLFPFPFPKQGPMGGVQLAFASTKGRITEDLTGSFRFKPSNGDPEQLVPKTQVHVLRQVAAPAKTIVLGS